MTKKALREDFKQSCSDLLSVIEELEKYLVIQKSMVRDTINSPGKPEWGPGFLSNTGPINRLMIATYEAEARRRLVQK